MSVPTLGDARLALRAPALLHRFNLAGAISAADVHVALRLGRLGGEGDERVLLAAALTVRALRAGAVCLVLAEREAMLVPEFDDDPAAGEDRGSLDAADLPGPEPWRAALEASPIVGGCKDPVQPGRPLRWVDGRLYLDRYWRAEQSVRREVDARLGSPIPGLDPLRVAEVARRLFPAEDEEGQRRAATAVVRGRFTVITGGPGTGKTTTVAGLLAVMQAVAGPGLRVALAAPTGKAAARLQESVRARLAELPVPDRDRVGQPEARTLHRLLGWRPGTTTRFRHDRRHHLPHDIVVVDETSMVSLPMMARLLDALRPQARLVLVGDPDQLASVEAGAVLGDLVARPTPDGARDHLVRLTVSRRYGDVIGRLARAVREGDAEAVIDLLRAGHDEIDFVEPIGDLLTETEVRPVRADAERAGLALVRAARAGDVATALGSLESHRLLVAHRRGPFGVAHWSARVEAWVAAADADADDVAHRGQDRLAGPWYPGRPLLVTVNDRDSGLYNGDIGVVVCDPDGGPGAVSAAFGDPARPVVVRPHRLPAVETVHAMTVHRAQGSQFARVDVLLPPEHSPLLTRELFYTAVTRARQRVRVVGSEAAVRAAVARPVRRASGLRYG